MIYTDFCGKKLSALGLGCMRFPTLEGDNGKVDLTATREMVDYAIAHGINYFDTAWGYHDGASELVMGELLSAYPRKTLYLASKFPGYDLSNMPKVEEIFEKQLQKCKVDYFDFYLFHNVCDINIDAYLDPQYGIMAYLKRQKENGRIRHLGFSTHGSLQTMRRFLDAYGAEMEFCQIQLNWLDWTMQNAKEKLAMLAEYHLPVWVMEPVRGGKLTQLEEPYRQALWQADPTMTAAAWAFRFLQGIPSVAVTLSGMSNMDQLRENIALYETSAPLSEQKRAALLDVAREMTRRKTPPCTACRYCTTHCPRGLDIPTLIDHYNEHVLSDGGFLAPMAIAALPPEKRPSACIGCRACEAVCPQNIRISEMMKDFERRLAR